MHSAIAGLASVTNIEHWYEDEPLEPGRPDLVPPDQEPPASEPLLNPKVPDATLVSLIIKHSKVKGGTTRAYLKAEAERYGFNTGSVSPTLVKLTKAKQIKRIGKGVYAFVK